MVFIHERWGPQHLLIRVGANNIFTRKIGNIAFIQELEATAFTRLRWIPLHIFLSDGVHSILSRLVQSKVLTLNIWVPQLLLTRNGVYIIYS